jgi:hypothetical protein
LNFQLGGVSIPIQAGLEFSQTYEPIGGSVLHRMQSGRAVKQTHYKKFRTSLSGQGWVPAGLDGLEYSEPLILKCAAPRSVSSESYEILIPSTRRNDPTFEPKGYALVKGHLIETNIIMQEDTAILDPVRYALSYQVHYYPEILVFAESPQVQSHITGAEFSWSLTCEEV